MDSRLVAILLADLSGYTEFSARSDRTALAAAVSQAQRLMAPVVEQSGGRIVKWIGDAVLAQFPSAIDAIHCGRRLQSVFVETAERSPTAIDPRLKVVVHAGDVVVDADGDIYGDCVNFLARMEKVAGIDEVYFSETVRRLIGDGEMPYEQVGEFEFKGIREPARIYRTCFGQTPIVREHVLLVQTNFISVQTLADRYGWDTVHPVLDEVTGVMLEAARRHGGVTRGTLQIGSFFSFPGAAAFVNAALEWQAGVARVRIQGTEAMKLRVAAHLGTLHVMKHTMMGRDIDIVRTLAAMGSDSEMLLTAAAAEAAGAEGALTPALAARSLTTSDLRECGSKRRWLARYADIGVVAIRYADLPPPARAPIRQV